MSSSAVTRTGDPVYDTFIKRSLGTLLPDCIKQLSESRPADPIEFISNSLYKAVDSQLYQREKEKYLKDCVRESGLLQQERAERKARMDMLLKAQKENKEKLKQARDDEISALMDLTSNATKYGIELSPRSLKRIRAIKREEQLETEAERPLEISMPSMKKAAGKEKGRWVEVEEAITTDSGTVIHVKTRKWKATGRRGSTASDDDLAHDEKKPGKKIPKHLKSELGSVFAVDDPRGSLGSGTIGITRHGFTFESPMFGTMQAPDPLDKHLAPADNPDIWARERFDCHTLYDHELYIRCDATLSLDINQHASPPRQLVREYLESVSRGSTSEEEKSSSHGGFLRHSDGHVFSKKPRRHSASHRPHSGGRSRGNSFTLDSHPTSEPAVKPAGVSPEPAAKSAGVSPEPTAKPAGVSPEPAAKSEGVSPEPAAKSAGVSPEPTAKPAGVSPEPAAKSAGVSPEPAAKSASDVRAEEDTPGPNTSQSGHEEKQDEV